MDLLLDTHAFIWFDKAPNKLSDNVKALLKDTSHQLYVSSASLWEMQIKMQLNKLDLRLPLAELVEDQQDKNDVKILAIEPQHIYGLAAMPEYHKDPFDRLIIAQASAEQFSLVTVDEKIHKYSDHVKIIW